MTADINKEKPLDYLKGLKADSALRSEELYYLLKVNNYLFVKEKDSVVEENKRYSTIFFEKRSILDLEGESRHQTFEYCFDCESD